MTDREWTILRPSWSDETFRADGNGRFQVMVDAINEFACGNEHHTFNYFITNLEMVYGELDDIEVNVSTSNDTPFVGFSVVGWADVLKTYNNYQNLESYYQTVVEQNERDLYESLRAKYEN